MDERNRLRGNKFQVYLNDAEKDILERNAYEYGMSKSDYVRKLIMYEKMVGRQWLMDKEDGKKLIYEMNRIGNNLNQIAYNVNVQKAMKQTDFENLKKNYSEFIRLVAKLPFLDKDAVEEWEFFADKIVRTEITKNEGGEG